MKEEYDVVIVGAGPAGAQCARYICQNSNLRVLLMDNTQEIGEPKKSTAGTFADCIRDFSIPNNVIMSRTERVVLEGPSKSVEFPVEGCVLEFGAFKKFLVEDAVKNGCELAIATTVTHPIIENKKVCGVQYHSFMGDGQVRATIVVDATGPSATICRQVGLRKEGVGEHWVGLEFEMDGVSVEKNDMMLLKFDQTIAPGGYAWIFSAGEDNRAKIGLCWGQKGFKKMGGTGSLISYLQKWVKEDARLIDSEAVEIHGGDAVFIDGKISKTYNGLIAIGDSVSTINPIAGEGIRPALHSAVFAGETIIDAFNKKDFSKGSLSSYESKWEDYAHTWKLCSIISHKLYGLSNEELDTLFVKLGKMDSDIAQKCLSFNMSTLDILKSIKNLL